MTFRFLRLRRGHCPRDAVVYPRLTGTLYHLRYELDEIFVGDFRVWTPRFGKLSREMGTRRRPLSVHALCLRAIFGYDVAEWGSVAGQIVAASMQPRCRLQRADFNQGGRKTFQPLSGLLHGYLRASGQTPEL